MPGERHGHQPAGAQRMGQPGHQGNPGSGRDQSRDGVPLLNPIVAIAAGAVFLHERVTAWTLIGFSLALAGSFLITRPTAAAAEEPVPAPAEAPVPA